MRKLACILLIALFAAPGLFGQVGTPVLIDSLDINGISRIFSIAQVGQTKYSVINSQRQSTPYQHWVYSIETNLTTGDIVGLVDSLRIKISTWYFASNAVCQVIDTDYFVCTLSDTITEYGWAYSFDIDSTDGTFGSVIDSCKFETQSVESSTVISIGSGDYVLIANGDKEGTWNHWVRTVSVNTATGDLGSMSTDSLALLSADSEDILTKGLGQVNNSGYYWSVSMASRDVTLWTFTVNSSTGAIGNAATDVLEINHDYTDYIAADWLPTSDHLAVVYVRTNSTSDDATLDSIFVDTIPIDPADGSIGAITSHAFIRLIDHKTILTIFQTSVDSLIIISGRYSVADGAYLGFKQVLQVNASTGVIENSNLGVVGNNPRYSYDMEQLSATIFMDSQTISWIYTFSIGLSAPSEGWSNYVNGIVPGYMNGLIKANIASINGLE